MKKIPLKSASQRAVVEALDFFIEHNNNPEMKQSQLRPFLIARKEFRRGMEDKTKKYDRNKKD